MKMTLNQKICAILTVTLPLSSCVFGKISTKYTSPYSPRYASTNLVRPVNVKKETLTVVSYNIKISQKIAEAINLLKKSDMLRDADILCLQEMDLHGVKKIAQELKYNFVYYPAVKHRFRKKDFGNAILSKWPIWNDKKTLLTEQEMEKLQRIAVSAIIEIKNKKLMVFSVHQEVVLGNSERIRQMEKILKAIPPFIKHIVIAGDFNTYSASSRTALLNYLREADFTHSTEAIGWTYKYWYLFNKKSMLDHIFTKKMHLIESGKVTDRSPSDHIPVWVKLKFNQ